MGDPKPVTAADVERLRLLVLEKECAELECDRDLCVALRMVRSVLEIHKEYQETGLCAHCYGPHAEARFWPCPPVKALVRCLLEEE